MALAAALAVDGCSSGGEIRAVPASLRQQGETEILFEMKLLCHPS
jgi:hypothetical protein